MSRQVRLRGVCCAEYDKSALLLLSPSTLSLSVCLFFIDDAEFVTLSLVLYCKDGVAICSMRWSKHIYVLNAALSKLPFVWVSAVIVLFTLRSTKRKYYEICYMCWIYCFARFVTSVKVNSVISIFSFSLCNCIYSAKRFCNFRLNVKLATSTL